MQLNKSIFISILIYSLFLTACSKNGNVTNNYFETNSSTVDAINKTDSLDLNKWNTLVLNQQKPNYALAELFASEVSKNDHDNVVKFIADNLSPQDLDSIFENFVQSNQKRRNDFLYYQAPWSTNQLLISKSLQSSDEIKSAEFDNYENQIKTNVILKIQSNLIKEILDTYEKDANRAAEILSSEFASKISEEDQSAIVNDLKNNKPDSAINKIKNAILKVNAFNDLKARADITIGQATELAAVALIANHIYLQIKDTKTFEKIKQVVREAKEINEKRKEILGLCQGISTNYNNLKNNYSDLRHSSTDIRKDSAALLSSLKKETSTFSKNERSDKEQIELLYNRFYKNKNAFPKDTTAVDARYTEKLDKISVNIDKAATSIGNLSNNLNNILSNVNKITESLGIKLGKDAVKVMDKAQKASAIISTVSKTMQAFASGGVISAANSLLAGGLGFGGGADQTTAMLESMDKKLDQIADLQKQSIELQLDTMKMIKDMAQMIDEYHQQEMQALADIRSTQMVQTEIEKTLANTDIRKCERLIAFHLSTINGVKSNHSPFLDPTLLSITIQNFYGKDHSFNNLKYIIRSTEFNGFNDCQSGINEAFGSFNAYENPILGIYASADGSDMYKFQGQTYLPLVNFLESMVQENIGDKRDYSNSELALHVPIKNFSDIKLKSQQIASPSQFQSNEDAYILDRLISPKALMRYANSLLILYPLLDVEKDSWEKGAVAVINSFFDELLAADDNNKLHQRSYYLLKNALFLTRSAIAQEAILAGEPLLLLIKENKEAVLQEDNSKNINRAIYSNKLLLKNYLEFSILNNSETNIEKYKQLLENYNPANLESFIKEISGLNGKILKDENNIVFLKTINSSIELPSVVELKEGTLLYSENMVKLIKLESKIIDAILQIAPDFNTESDAKKYSAILLQKNI